MPDRVERLTNLLAVLLDTRRPLTLEEIVERVPGYPAEPASARRQFERDKATLREVGIPVTVEPANPFEAENGYRIRPSDYELPVLALTAEERVALHLAVTAVSLDGGTGQGALFKLGGMEGAGASPLAALPAAAALPALFDAYRRQAEVSFAYRGDARRLWPYGILFRNGHWYAVGHDPQRKAIRAFRADRIEGTVTAGREQMFERPAGFDPAEALRDEPWSFGDEEPCEAVLLVDAVHAPWVAAELGEAAVAERRPDGGVVVRLAVTNRSAFRSFVFGLLDSAEVLGPADLRADFVAHLEGMASCDSREAGMGPPPTPR